MDDTRAPKLDPRSHDDVIAQTEALATAYTAALPGGPWRPSARANGTFDLGGTLVRLFGGMVDHLIAQLNQVPDMHRLAFTALLGARRIAPQPARAAVTFLLAAGEGTGEVPAGAQLAASGPAGPVVFETERALQLTRARLAAVFVRDVAGEGGYTDATAIATGSAPGAFAALGVGQPFEHELYLAADALVAVPGAATLTVVIEAEEAAAPAVVWEAFGSRGWSPLSNVSVAGSRLTLLVPVAVIGATSVNGVTARWLRATPAAAPPRVAITAAVEFNVTQKAQVDPAARPGAPVPFDAAYANGQPLDFARDVLPFGERPRFNDTFYFASDAAFAVAGTTVTLTLGFTLPPLGVNASPDLMLRWETWDGQTATLLGTSASSGAVTGGITDSTRAFTLVGGAVTFTLSSAIPRARIGAVTSRWVRARIVVGNYGTELTATASGGVVTITQASFRPPSLSSVALAWRGGIAALPTAVVRRTAQTYEDVTAQARTPEGAARPVSVYRAAPELVYQDAPDDRASLQLGFDRAFEPATATIYVQVFPPASPDPAQLGDVPPPRHPPRLAWEYFNEAGWTALPVEDDTQGLSRSGLVRFLAPRDAVPFPQFGHRLYWLRARCRDLEIAPTPRLGRVLVNTTWAAHAHAIVGELLGASNGARGQRFTLARRPVLDGQRIEVGEPEPPGPRDLAALRAAEGPDVVAPDPETGLTWVRWLEAPDFWASGPRDRHYTFDAATGTVTFGDGVAGMIPPVGIQNVRAAYRVGGGPAGNVAAAAITDLKTTVPAVDRVTNHEPAVGGAPIEPAARMLERAARTLRHGGRAVAAQDFADLALEASLAVARAVAVTPSFLPLGQAGGPLSDLDNLRRDGQVIVVIVPADVQPGMSPSVDLCAEVEAFLRARCAPGAQVAVTGPSWVGADIEIHVAASRLERSDAVVAAARTAVAQLLDPISGGDGRGWSLGRRPRVSDLVAHLAGIPDLDHLSLVRVTCDAPFDDDDTQPHLAGAALSPRDALSLLDALRLSERVLVYARSITVTASQPR